MALKDTTREDVLKAIASCDELGEVDFLAQHGYRPSLRYRLVVGGKNYPSKAILGVAAGLTARQFSGGAAHTVRTLSRLGFQVRKVVAR
jgi:5-methylcytosine-specific restriction protein A